MRIRQGLIAAALAIAAPQALADGAMLNGSGLSPLWVVPFAGILLSSAVGPGPPPPVWPQPICHDHAVWGHAVVFTV